MAGPGMLVDPSIIVAIQSIWPAFTIFASRGELLDSTPWYLLVISVFYLGYHPRFGIRLAVLFGITSGLNEALKLAFHLPRPYWVSPLVQVFNSHSSFGFPSGAAMYGAAIYGYIANVTRRFWIIIICALLLLCTSLARLFAGVHFVLDVMGGLFFGFLLLLLFFLAQPRLEKYAGSLSRRGRMCWILVLGGVPLMLTIPAYLSLGDWQLPASWAATAFQQTGAEIDPAQIRYAWGATGVILGSLAGYEVLRSKGGWAPPADLLRRAIGIFAGAGSVLILWSILSTIGSVSDHPDPVQNGYSILTMAVVLFWLTACIPLIYRRAGVCADGS